MNPQAGNPYLAFLNKLRQNQGNAQGAPGASALGSMANALGSQAGANSVPQTDPTGAGPARTGASPQQLQQTQGGPQAPGAQAPTGGSNTKVLLQAIQALHSFTQAGADPQEIAVVRSMIVILNQLIQRDQMAQGGQPAGAPQGAPAGGQSAIAQAMAQARGQAQAPQPSPAQRPAGPQVGAQPGQVPA